MFEYKATEEIIRVGIDPLNTFVLKESEFSPSKLFYRDDKRGIWLYQANCLDMMDQLITKYPLGKFDMIFADPPYFLSNGGFTCHAGRMFKYDTTMHKSIH